MKTRREAPKAFRLERLPEIAEEAEKYFSSRAALLALPSRVQWRGKRAIGCRRGKSGASPLGLVSAPLIQTCSARRGITALLERMKPLTHPLTRRLVRYFWREWIRPLALPLLLVTTAKSALADINYVPSGSMEPTLLAGDVVFINKLAYDLRVPFTFTRLARWAEPARGDVVVCFAPDEGTRLVKRVAALPGDTIELRHDVLFINGVAQRYTAHASAAENQIDDAERGHAVFATEQLGERAHAVMALPGRPALRDFGPVTVPRGSYFMLGDNRDNSRDSRYFGFMARHAIIGRVTGVAVSADLQHWLKPRLERFCTAVN